MRNEQGSKLAETMLTAVEWAGRASVEQRREQKFLLYAIALEALVLPKKNTGELTWRLRTRVARLIGRSAEERAELSSTVNRLYAGRSRIVHSGSYEVADEDLGSLETIARRCIRQALRHPQFRRFSTPDDLDDWFEAQLLR